jgi:hypothetical protein
MISSLIGHPAFPLAIGSLFIFLFKEKANLISIGSILISLFILLFITNNVDYVYKSSLAHVYIFGHLCFIFW